MKIRAKFYCSEVKKTDYGTEIVNFGAVTPAHDATPENEQFWKATPCGTLYMCIDNPAAQGQFEQGKYYYLDITPAE